MKPPASFLEYICDLDIRALSLSRTEITQNVLHMKKGFIILAAAFTLAACSGGGNPPKASKAALEELSSGWENPPQSARTRVWWHWMNGNITKEGIRHDIEWFSRIGLGGFQTFDAAMNSPVVVDERLVYMTPGWKNAFRYAMTLADSLGLEVAIASSPGWSSTGGPWVEPQDAMKKLVWRTVLADGGKNIDITLPDPFTSTGTFQNLGSAQGSVTTTMFSPGKKQYYEDVAVVAVKMPEGRKTLSELGAKVSASQGSPTLSMLTDDDIVNGFELPADKAKGYSWIQYEFPEATTIYGVKYAGGSDLYLETSQDGKTFTKVCDIDAPTGVTQITVSIPKTNSKFYRVVYPNPKPRSSYFGMSAAATSTRVTELELLPYSKVNHSEEKAAFSESAGHFQKVPSPATGEQFPSEADVVDVTSFVKDGKLAWNAPEGKWKIYRFGYSLTGKQNHPAPAEATGLEVDKLDKEAWMDYFRKYMDMYKEASGGMVGQRGIQYILTDSYEAEQMTWTKTIAEEFRSRRGYDLFAWMPALTGEVISSSEETEKFLFDWRETLGELFRENYDRINEIAKEYGMKGRYTESHENGRVFVGDGMDLKMTAAVPMSAIWMPNGGGGSALPMARADIKESSSTAHVYGQNIAAAESFTAAGLLNNAWSYYPGNIKYTADIALYEGLNRFVIHESAHQPSDAHKPGLGLMIFGQWFNRHETWADYARYWVDYLSRSCYMLQQGRYVADVLWYYGEDTNIAGIYGHELPEIPEGFAYDFINPYGVLNELSVKNGKIVTNSGMEYSVLVLGEHCKKMSIEVIRKLSELASKGAVICGQIPESPAGLYDNPYEFQRLVSDIWYSGRPNVHTGQLSGVLKAHGIEPDFTYVAPTDIKYVHRTTPGKDIYWVRNFSDSPVSATIKMRDAVGYIQVYNPETGKEVFDALNGNTLNLEANQALFVVADKFSTGEAKPYEAPKIGSTVAFDGTWKATFEGIETPEGEVEFPTLKSYTESDDPALKYFSGVATYTNTFTLSKKEVPSLKGLSLNLGDVEVMADVFINGEHAGFLWKDPYKVDFTGLLKPGKNTIEIKVINLWPNRLIGDAQEGATPVTYTAMPFYRANSPLFPAGLIGPVQMKRILK